MTPAKRVAKESAMAADLLTRMADEIERDANILRSMSLLMSGDNRAVVSGIVQRLDALSDQMCEMEESADA